MKTVKTVKIRTKPKNRSHLFQPGQSGNPNGRPKGGVNGFSLSEFVTELRKVEQKERKSLYQHIIERAYKNDKVLIAIIGKIVPNYTDNLLKSGQNDDMLQEEIELIPDNGLNQNRIKKYIAQ